MAKKERMTSVSEDLLGSVEFCVLAATSGLGDEAYGMSVFEALRERAYPSISFGSVYTALERMTWKKYLESELGEPESVRGGRARKYYRLTALGKKVLRFTEMAFTNSMKIGPPGAA